MYILLSSFPIFESAYNRVYGTYTRLLVCLGFVGGGWGFCFVLVGWLFFFSPWKETKILLGAVPQPRWEQLGWGQSSPPTLLQSSQRAVFCQKIAIGYATAVKPISLPKKNVTKG